MSFTVQLESDFVSVEAGANTPVTVEVRNRGELTDQFEIEVEGLDPEWTAVPIPSFSVPSADTVRAKVLMMPPRSSENMAGRYPFVIRVRSLESGDVRTLQGTLEIKPYFHLTMELLPRKGSFSPTSQQNRFVATIVNLGNSELTLQLYGSDPEDALAYQFEQEQVVLGPGQQRDVPVIVTPTRKGAFSSPRLHGFTVSARSREYAGVVAAAQAQLEQKPFVSIGSLLVVLILAVLAIGWFLTLPKRPTLDSFTVNQSVVQPEESITLSWTSSHAKRVRITYGTQVLVESGKPSGTFEFRPTTSGEVIAIAIRDDRESLPQRLTVEVRQPEKAPMPVIREFRASSLAVEPGEKFFVYYKVQNARRILLAPGQQVLDPSLESIEIEAPSDAGTYRLKLIAENASNDRVESRELRLSVALRPRAAILAFVVEPASVSEIEGKTTVRWNVRGAEKIELQFEGQTLPLEGASGRQEITVTKSGSLVLVARDDQGSAVRKTVRVQVVPTEPPVDDSTPPPSDDPQPDRSRSETVPPPARS